MTSIFEKGQALLETVNGDGRVSNVEYQKIRKLAHSDYKKLVLALEGSAPATFQHAIEVVEWLLDATINEVQSDGYPITQDQWREGVEGLIISIGIWGERHFNV